MQTTQTKYNSAIQLESVKASYGIASNFANFGSSKKGYIQSSSEIEISAQKCMQRSQNNSPASSKI